MVDIHTHLLPEYDDGPQSVDETRKMLEIAEKGGTHTVVVTPHILDFSDYDRKDEILEKFELVKNLIIYPDNMIENLNLTRGLVFSQTVLLRLVDKGLSREQAYKLVQTSAMNVWQDKNKNLKDELLKSEDIKKYITASEINNIFDNKKMLKNVDLIFARTVEK